MYNRDSIVCGIILSLIAANVYEARNTLLGLEGPRVVADIPQTYHIPDTPSTGAVHEGKPHISFKISVL
jgi:hypothetical protein